MAGILKNLRSFSLDSELDRSLNTKYAHNFRKFSITFYASFLSVWHFKCTRHRMTCLCGVMCWFRGSTYFIVSLAVRAQPDRDRTNNIQRDKMCNTCVCKMLRFLLCACSTLIIRKIYIFSFLSSPSHIISSEQIGWALFYSLFWFAAIL